MQTQAELWKRAAETLGIRVQAPARIAIGSRTSEFTALLVDFGGRRGMVADPNWKSIAPFAEALVEAGFGYSCVQIDEESDLKDMLRNWGWCADSTPPQWMDE